MAATPRGRSLAMSALAAAACFTTPRCWPARFSWLRFGRDGRTAHGFGLGAGCPDSAADGLGIDAGVDRALAQLLATGVGVVADSIVEAHGRVVVAGGVVEPGKLAFLCPVGGSIVSGRDQKGVCGERVAAGLATVLARSVTFGLCALAQTVRAARVASGGGEVDAVSVVDEVADPVGRGSELVGLELGPRPGGLPDEGDLAGVDDVDPALVRGAYFDQGEAALRLVLGLDASFRPRPAWPLCRLRWPAISPCTALR